MKHVCLKATAASAVALTIATIAPTAGLAASSAHGVKVSVRVEGMNTTLIPQTSVLTKAAQIDKDGKPADACEGDTAAVALQDATHGRWTAGTYSSGLGYPVVGIGGESYPFTSDYYWSLWLGGKPATTGICEATLSKGEQILLFPQCSQESAAKCPQGMFEPSVLRLTGPSRARKGKTITLSVASLANATGNASAGVGVTLKAAGQTVKTNASGKAKLKFGKAGSYRIVATAPNSVRDELTVKVSG